MTDLLFDFGKRDFDIGWEHENKIESFELKTLFGKVKDFDFFIIPRSDVSTSALEDVQKSLYPSYNVNYSFNEKDNSYLVYVENNMGDKNA